MTVRVPARVPPNRLARDSRERLVRALQDPLGPDVDPRAGRHLAVHRQAESLEAAELLPGRPVGHQVGVGDQHPGRPLVGGHDADRLAGLDQQRLVAPQVLQRPDDRVEGGPAAGRSCRCRRRRRAGRDARPPRGRGCSSACAGRPPAASPGRRGRARGAPVRALRRGVSVTGLTLPPWRRVRQVAAVQVKGRPLRSIGPHDGAPVGGAVGPRPRSAPGAHCAHGVLAVLRGRRDSPGAWSRCASRPTGTGSAPARLSATETSPEAEVAAGLALRGSRVRRPAPARSTRPPVTWMRRSAHSTRDGVDRPQRAVEVARRSRRLCTFGPRRATCRGPRAPRPCRSPLREPHWSRALDQAASISVGWSTLPTGWPTSRPCSCSIFAAVVVGLLVRRFSSSARRRRERGQRAGRGEATVPVLW